MNMTPHSMCVQHAVVWEPSKWRTNPMYCIYDDVVVVAASRQQARELRVGMIRILFYTILFGGRLRLTLRTHAVRYMVAQLPFAVHTHDRLSMSNTLFLFY